MSDKHLWVCERPQGKDDEIIVSTKLNAEQIAALSEDPSLAEEYCEGGDIVCSDCGITFTGSPRRHTSRKPLQDIEDNLE